MAIGFSKAACEINQESQCELINYIIQYLLCNLTNSLVHTPLLWDDGAACVFVLRHQFNYENMLKQRHLPCTAFSLHIESRTAD